LGSERCTRRAQSLLSLCDTRRGQSIERRKIPRSIVCMNDANTLIESGLIL
jgi:hypothetical protein